MNNVASHVEFKESKFLKFLYNYVLSIRSKMWIKSGIECKYIYINNDVAEGQYAVSQMAIHIVREMIMNSEYSWSEKSKPLYKDALLGCEKLEIQERDIVLELLSGSVLQSSIPGQIYLNEKREQVYVCGYSSTWKNPDDMVKSKDGDIPKMNIQMTISGGSIVIGSIIDETSKVQSELQLFQSSSLQLLNSPLVPMDILTDKKLLELFASFFEKQNEENNQRKNIETITEQ